jgi:hypothetical protein
VLCGWGATSYGATRFRVPLSYEGRHARRVDGRYLFVQGAIEDAGRIVASFEEARDVLRAWS